MSATQPMPRREFLKNTGLTGIALILGFSAADAAGTARLTNLSGLPGPDPSEPFGLTPYLSIDRSGKITFFNPKPEMGQGTYQSVTALVAEELEVPLDMVHVITSSGQKGIDSQSAGGSSSIRGGYTKLRKVGAAAREMLQSAAAKQWNVPVSECAAAGNATIVHQPSGKSLGYGQLVEAAAMIAVPANPTLKDPKDFKILGKPSARADVPLKVNGSAMFGIDASLPGMAFASVERCPVLGSKLVSFDDTAALKVPGVLKVVKALRVQGKHRDEGVAVVAENYWAAVKGRKALKIQWDHQGLDQFSTTGFEQHLRELAKSDGLIAHNSGDFDKAMQEAPKKLEALYETPVVSHSTMEPMNCLAHWKEDDKVDIWTSSQGASLIKRELAQTLGIPEDNITPHINFLGGGFGRRLASDFASEAAFISKAAGRPVKVIWTREDDTRMGPFRPMTFSAMRGALSADGKALAFQHKVVSPSINATKNDKYDKTKPDRSMTEGISDQKYEIPNMKNAYVFADIHIPMQAWRSVTSSTLAYAHESFIDEMAVAAGKDPMAFRLEMLSAPSDTKKVLLKLKEVSNWDQPLPKGWGRGVAQYEFFAGLAGNVVEVSSTSGGGVKIEKVYAVIDLGTVVNPSMVEAQVEGAIVMAITAATKDAIRFEKGQAIPSNFHNNRMLRINEMPPVEVHILAEGGAVIKGVGEPGLPPVAPALCNAIFAATGKRIRRLPFDINKI
ncbi:molybdopterin-dependent oxidoreductase [Flavitalea sp. BT771]|uniref:xanthine dehydrogenase family protein molybdopterin-binding subunit n=1 Tax=Flavitalea sp. BT771 TaxID=3063329 RepID=UPI0026E309D4|nr:molybdopterin cofactor-binding domain-containing protein [Flavitalea sp. BT771]MDO6434980.1 molybdopterin-dependent oxidoreductase [Flavitalea sp. BT771]MDV6223880.1 molybdopterin cofactor-binding domain-containing protein [Flavitalea sp. BT771]